MEFAINGSKPARLGTTLQIAKIAETVNVTGGLVDNERESRRLEEQVRKQQLAQLNAPSANVFSLQRRVAGILPVHPLVMEEETKITFQYKSR
ncbi:MAG: hypothetical protein ABJC10_08260 [Acidobacteriota bacterium]